MRRQLAAAKRKISAALCTSLLLSAVFTVPLAAEDPAGKQPQVLAPGWSELEFEPPAAGSYELPVIALAGDGRVIDSHRADTTLHALMGDKVVILSFIYSSCSDANGCPLATHVLTKLRSKLQASDAGMEGVRFISLSFDPVHDTPAVMRRYGDRFINESLDWYFLTTRNQTDLDPILESYGQSIVRDPLSAEEDGGAISHILRVYLIDPQRRIRNIYSASYLHANTMLNDILTLQHEASGAGSNPEAAPNLQTRQGPGDAREGYETLNFRTTTQSLESRRGPRTRLMTYVDTVPLGLPPIPQPPENLLTQAKAELGRLLFFDRRLSHNNTFSCAMCHVPEQGFASNELATAVGIEGQTVRRNSPTIYNVAYLERLFHDGRESSLEQQIWGPLLAPNEMGNPSIGQVLESIRSIPGYTERFESAFDGRSPSMETVGMALASYERLLVSADSRFDRWFYGDDSDALDSAEQAGFQLFSGKAGCSACHQVGPDWALFTDNKLHNTGIGYRRSMSGHDAEIRIQIAPGEYIMVRQEFIDEAAEKPPSDIGLYEITGNPDDRWKYRTPSLRNVALTSPYMHDGSIPTLEDVVGFYDLGGVENPLRDPLVRPLGLSDREKSQLVAYLRTLTGSNVDILVADAFSVPVGNTESE